MKDSTKMYQEIDDCLKAYTVDELTLDTQMIHSNMPWYYDTDKLYYFENVVYLYRL